MAQFNPLDKIHLIYRPEKCSYYSILSDSLRNSLYLNLSQPAMCLLASSSISSWELQSNTKKKSVNVKISGSVYINNLTMAKNMAVQGYGIVALPRFIAQDEIILNRIKRVLDDWHPKCLNNLEFLREYFPQ